MEFVVTTATGQLAGITVIEFEAIGPVPFACSLLGDLGASVTRIVRPLRARNALPGDLADMGRSSGTTIEIDLKESEGVEAARSLVAESDVLIEGFRPGTLERLGLGPEVVCGRTPELIYARVTGWGQEGPYSSMAGHDINYIGLAGALHAMGPESRPTPPLNLLGDYAGGALYAVIGILAALAERERTGKGQIIDAAMVDGTSALLAPIRSMQQIGMWTGQRQSNLLDGGAPFYRTYRTADDKFVAVGALEQQFFDAMLDGLGIDATSTPDRLDQGSWPELALILEERFASRTQAEWQEVFDGTDACVTPVLAMDETPDHPHNSYRRSMVTVDGVDRPTPAPRFSTVL
jgi:alpha-methylacyl-CoA racemase